MEDASSSFMYGAPEGISDTVIKDASAVSHINVRSYRQTVDTEVVPVSDHCKFAIIWVQSILKSRWMSCTGYMSLP